MNSLQALVLGILQGLCEFLPVSSSGHLVLAQRIFGLEQGGILLEVLLHVGTLVAVCIVLWEDIWELIKKPLQIKTLLLIVATIPAVLCALLLGDAIDVLFGGGFLGFSFLITSALLFFAHYMGKKAGRHREKPREELNMGDAIVMGIMQAVAILPGVSRSGSTLVGGLTRGAKRETVARFAFLMSVPAVLGSLVLESKNLLEGGIGDFEVLPLLLGVLASLICGILAIRLMLWVVQKAKLVVFAYYTTALGVLILLDQWVFHFFF